MGQLDDVGLCNTSILTMAKNPAMLFFLAFSFSFVCSLLSPVFVVSPILKITCYDLLFCVCVLFV